MVVKLNKDIRYAVSGNGALVFMCRHEQPEMIEGLDNKEQKHITLFEEQLIYEYRIVETLICKSCVLEVEKFLAGIHSEYKIEKE